MPPFNRKNKYARTSIAAMLIVAMLCVHWVGLVHRVIHADGIDSISSSSRDIAGADKGITFVTAVIDNQVDSAEEKHFCSLFDAAALGSSVHSTHLHFVPVPNVQVLALWTAFASWQSPFACHFSSRAPPRA